MKEKRIKILFTIPNFDTAGSGKALLNIVTRLDKKLFEPHIACLHDKGEFFKVVQESGIPIHIFQFTTPMIGRIKGILHCWKISRLMKKINPHIIHSFHYAADYSEALAARMAGIPWIYTKKNMNWGGKSKNGWKLRSFLAAHILAQNTDMIRYFFPYLKNVSLVPRGVDTDEFIYKEKDATFRGFRHTTGKEGRVGEQFNMKSKVIAIQGNEIMDGQANWEASQISDAERFSQAADGINGNKTVESFDAYLKRKEIRATARKTAKQKVFSLNKKISEKELLTT